MFLPILSINEENVIILLIKQGKVGMGISIQGPTLVLEKNGLL